MDTIRIRSYARTKGYVIGLLDIPDERARSLAGRDDHNVALNEPQSPMTAPEHSCFVRVRDSSQCAAWRSGDIILVDSTGHVRRQHDRAACEYAFVLSTRCNSNCIMCPSSQSRRCKTQAFPMEVHREIASRLPSDICHVTITGGEPFLAGSDVFSFFDLLKRSFDKTNFLLLTNGRALALKRYADQLCVTLPHSTLVGIPLHGASESLHDAITQVPGSFRQTCQGIERLLIREMPVELRIVVHRYNSSVLPQMADMIAKQFPTVRTVKIMGMEMLGSAMQHASELWLSYKEVFGSARPAVERFMEAGIDVAFYNLPLCAVPPEFWLLCHRSISPTKIRYLPECKECYVRDACGGIFAGSDKFAVVSPVRG